MTQVEITSELESLRQETTKILNKRANLLVRLVTEGHTREEVEDILRKAGIQAQSVLISKKLKVTFLRERTDLQKALEALGTASKEEKTI